MHVIFVSLFEAMLILVKITNKKTTLFQSNLPRMTNNDICGLTCGVCNTIKWELD